MPKTNLNTNKQFMIGNGIPAFAVIIIVVVFTYISMGLSQEKKDRKSFDKIYCIELSRGFIGDSVSLLINDSLLFNKQINSDSLRIKIKRFAEHNALLIIDKQTQKVSAFNLSDKGENISLRKDKDGIQNSVR